MHVDPMDLKQVLGQVNTNSRDLHGGYHFSVQVVDYAATLARSGRDG